MNSKTVYDRVAQIAHQKNDKLDIIDTQTILAAYYDLLYLLPEKEAEATHQHNMRNAKRRYDRK